MHRLEKVLAKCMGGALEAFRNVKHLTKGLLYNKKKLLGAKGIATRNKDATRGTPGHTTRSKDATRGTPGHTTGAKTLLGALLAILLARTLLGALLAILLEQGHY